MTTISTTSAPTLDARGQELLAELADLGAKLEASYREVRDVQGQLDAAPEKDVAAFVVSLRAGGPDPGGVAVAEATAALANAERRQHGLAQALEQVASDLRQHVTEHREALSKPLRAEVDKRRQEVGKALAQLDAAMHGLSEAEAAVQWVVDLAHKGRAFGTPTGDEAIGITVADAVAPDRYRSMRWAAVRVGIAEHADPERRRKRVEADQRSMRPGVPQHLPVEQFATGRP